MVHMMVYIKGVSQKRPPKLFWPISHNNKHFKNCFFFLQFQTCPINNSPKGLLNFKTYSVMSNAPNYYLGPLF